MVFDVEAVQDRCRPGQTPGGFSRDDQDNPVVSPDRLVMEILEQIIY
ncbi:MAG: hypothetical protein AB2598_10055 [Candidatus Thiodiazotropha sp.]